MSTSTEKAIVAEYAKSQTPLIFRVVAFSFASSAADISWLSLYPDESEMLFPPLTYLRYIRTLGITDCPNGNVIEVEGNFGVIDPAKATLHRPNFGGIHPQRSLGRYVCGERNVGGESMPHAS
jgi:hypothetical protein